ncbi:MAG: pallilysin-related adhesin [Spirochaetes bacterium]|nr:pallilysin-related adhesin [Spirochaetota bacterium]
MLLVFSLFFISCSKRSTQPTPSKPSTKASGISQSGNSINSQGIQSENSGQSRILVSLQPDDYVIQVLDTNLDIDQLDEQIIVFKKKNDPEDRIQILVVDFDTVRNTYVPVWIGKTLATNNRNFTLYTADILGDHVPEIVCMGRNNKGEQSLDIFRKTLPPQGLGLYYTSIFSLTSNGSIEIQEQPRSEAYRLLQKNDPSFLIFVFTRDPDSSNFMDLIKYTYYWNQREQRYVLGGQEKVPGQIQAEKQLAELFAKDAEAFEQFLSGPWYRISTDAKNPPANLQQEMVYFDPLTRRIVFYNKEMQEILVWRSSYRTIYRGLYINAHNEAIPSIQKQISISVLGMDTVEIQVRSIDDTWSSTYKKLSKELQNLYISSRNPKVALFPIQIEGTFKNELGTELVFQGNSFVLLEKEKKYSGVFIVYSFQDQTILELKALKSNGLLEFLRSYSMVLKEEKKGSQILRTLILTPVNVRASKVTVQSGEVIRLFQILGN